MPTAEPSHPAAHDPERMPLERGMSAKTVQAVPPPKETSIDRNRTRSKLHEQRPRKSSEMFSHYAESRQTRTP